MNLLTAMIQELVKQELRECMPYRAIVTDVSGDLIQFREVTADTEGDGYAPRLDTGETIVATDEVLVIGRKDPVVLGKVLR